MEQFIYFEELDFTNKTSDCRIGSFSEFKNFHATHKLWKVINSVWRACYLKLRRLPWKWFGFSLPPLSHLIEGVLVTISCHEQKCSPPSPSPRCLKKGQTVHQIAISPWPCPGPIRYEDSITTLNLIVQIGTQNTSIRFSDKNKKLFLMNNPL